MPTRGVQLDARTLDLIDGDKDGRVRAPEVLAAVRWAVDTFKDPEELLKAESTLRLAVLKDGPVLDGARRILTNLGKPGADTIALEDVKDTAKIFGTTRFNGDGVVTPESAGDDAAKKMIEEIMGTHGVVGDKSGKPGIDQARADAFFFEVRAFVDWQAASVAPQPEAKAAAGGSEILPLGEAT